MKVSDYVMDFLVKKGAKTIFTVSGGGSMHLLDSMGRNKALSYICNHHEQAAAFAAEGYARASGTFGVCLVSTAPAATNAVTGVLAAWNDSIPVFYISGQANSKYLIGTTGMRQRGVHEADIVSIVKPITKYATIVYYAIDIRFKLEKAFDVMMQGRKGPVWIDIPLDIQAAEIEPDKLEKYFDAFNLSGQEYGFPVEDIYSSLFEFNKRKHPLVILGGGTVSKINYFITFLTQHNMSFVSTKNTYGYIPYNTKNYLGMVGINGHRKANLALHNCDGLLILGSRLAFPITGYNLTNFAPNALKIQVDIDPLVLQHVNVKIDHQFNMDVFSFLPFMQGMPVYENNPFNDVENLPKYTVHSKFVDSYMFYMMLSQYTPQDSIIITDQGAAFYSWSQAYTMQKGQLGFTNGGSSPMGYGLPAAIGAWEATKRPIVLVVGDGGLEMNIQELQTIKQHGMNIKIFVFENQGYNSIKQTQDNFFKGFYVGSDPSSGLTCVDCSRIADAYGVYSYVIYADYYLHLIKAAFLDTLPRIVKIILDPHQDTVPKVKALIQEDGTILPGSFDNMYPYMEVLL
jgi:acetolactate synthase-1/2/3 large subunit